MPAKKKDPREKRDRSAVRVPMNDRERAQLDALRGELPRAIYIRERLFGDKQAKQDAPPAPISLPPPPAPKETILVPPPGKADAHGWHMRYTALTPTRGTLEVARPGEPWMAVDLIGVEATPQPGGALLLAYSDRSLVRKEEAQ
jgi:hypothetical protein